MARQAGSGRSHSRQKGQQPKTKPKPKERTRTGRRAPDSAASQARELRPLGMEAPIREALDPGVQAPDAVRGPHPEDRFAPLTAEHLEIEAGLAELAAFVGADEERATRWNRVATALETHARAEEWELYPRLRRIPPTRKAAREAMAAHARMRELTSRIDGKQGDDPEYRVLIEELARTVHEHVEMEEQELMPLAVQALGKAAVDAIVGAWVRQRRKLEAAVTDERVRPGRRGKRSTGRPRR